MHMKNILHILCAGGIVGFITFTTMVNMVHAETVIRDGFLQSDTVWDQAHSPYILNDVVTVPYGTTLTIEPGVDIRSDPYSEYGPYIYVAGTLSAHGSTENLINIGDIWGITIDHGKADISNTNISMRGSLMFIGAQGYVASSTISNSVGDIHSDGIYIKNSSVKIWGSKIENNTNGVLIKKSGGIFQVRKEIPDFVTDIQNIFKKLGLIKVAKAEVIDISEVSITGSRFLNNTQASILNDTSTNTSADHNWWGNIEGPSIVTSDIPIVNVPNAVKGNVIYDPWLEHDPFDVPKITECCSSILFLPGLEASRLYKYESGLFGIGTSTNRLWEPNRNDDIRKLFLDSNGSSIDQSIYVGGPIDKALGFVGIYGSFMNFLDNLSKKGTIKEWDSFSYDWRKSITEVVAGRVQRATTTDSLFEKVESLASRSKTGKVTLIAHSNGGLVTKYLVKTLIDIGKENLIDSVISVAVPYLGTPQAILSLLHGDGQSIAGGLILKKSVAKELGTNMPSAYSLLPSVGYFTKVFGPTIAYANTTTPPIYSSIKQNSFISTKANSALMNAAEIIHGILDPFSWPTTIARWAIVGWGKKTTKAIVYSGNKYNATTTSIGDGTVLVPSAIYNAGTTTAIDLISVGNLEHKNLDHSNILESSTTIKTIENIITTDFHNKNTKDIEETINKIPGVTIGEPDYNKESTFLVISTHSPVDLHVYDSYGNHTGIISTPNNTDEEIESGLYTFFENKIPGSNFESYGDENDPETYISLPEYGGQTYSVNIQGISFGEFTYNVQRIKGGDVLDSISYSSLPVTPFMSASTTVSTQISNTTVPIKLSSSTSALKIDVDGNGSTDIIVNANTKLDPTLILESLKKIVLSIVGSNIRSKNIIKRIDRIEVLVKNNKLKKIHDNTEKLKKFILHKKNKILSDKEKSDIIDMTEVFISQFE